LGDRKAPTSRGRQRRRPISKARFREMIEDATVDARDESEQLSGLYTMIENNLGVPFETTVLGVPVTVKSLDLTERDEIVAICVRGRERQAISILDLPLPSPLPAGAEWIEAYRYWARRG